MMLRLLGSHHSPQALCLCLMGPGPWAEPSEPGVAPLVLLVPVPPGPSRLRLRLRLEQPRGPGNLKSTFKLEEAVAALPGMLNVPSTIPAHQQGSLALPVSLAVAQTP